MGSFSADGKKKKRNVTQQPNSAISFPHPSITRGEARKEPSIMMMGEMHVGESKQAVHTYGKGGKEAVATKEA